MYNIVVYFLAGPEVCRLVSVSTHTSYLQIDPLSETLAEVALDVDWISAADSSFGFSSPINFARARHWSDKAARAAASASAPAFANLISNQECAAIIHK